MSVFRRFNAPVRPRVSDPEVDRVLRSLYEAVQDIQSTEILRGRLIKGVELEDGVRTAIPHGLGRQATVFISPPVGGASGSTGGRIEQFLPDSTLYFDPSRQCALEANGWTNTITVDVWVF